MGDLWKRGGGAPPKGAAGAASADCMEQQNEALLGSLQSKIAAMKQVKNLGERPLSASGTLSAGMGS